MIPVRGAHVTQLGVDPLAVAGAGIGALTRKPGPGQSDLPRYGMTMWFEVEVENPGRRGTGRGGLGRWSACKGLGVEFGFEPVWSGGDYESPYFVPTSIQYGRITLERATERADSAAVLNWLETVAEEWIGSPQGGAGLVASGANNGAASRPGYPGSTVVIKLFSSVTDGAGAGNTGTKAKRSGTATPNASQSREVATWTLRQAIPVSWKGPDLSSKGGDIAIESLTLVHRGFLAATPSGPTNTPQSTQDQGKFTLTYQNETLGFQFNPRELVLDQISPIEDTKTSQRVLRNDGTPAQEEGKLNISLSEVCLEGADEVEKKYAKLQEWIEPVKDEHGKLRPKILKVQMGAGPGQKLKKNVYLKQFRCTYNRFTASGVPSRAKVTISLVVEPEANPGADPSPGGQPGDRAHVVTGGDSVQSLSTAAGKPADDWRGVADSNGIDDPLRLTSGQAVRLPGR